MLLSTLLSILSATTALAAEWPIPIPASLLPTQKHQQQRFDLNLPDMERPANVRLIQTTEGRYQWTGDVEQLLRDGVKLMDVFSVVETHY